MLFDLLPSAGRTWRSGYFWPDPAKWTVIDGGELEFTGPVALWQLKKQTLRAGTDGPAIDIETDCHGPMPRLQLDLIKKAQEFLQEKQADTQGKNR